MLWKLRRGKMRRRQNRQYLRTAFIPRNLILTAVCFM